MKAEYQLLAQTEKISYGEGTGYRPPCGTTGRLAGRRAKCSLEG